ncbi:MAG: hypothetical protein PHH47_00410 [Gallionella sp.]|jgi:hypothetical protein|nr:hypothetical protein [Gallionella sp.]MDD4947401.1 hypothetical protein [Gallionella sp.]MDO9054324.1 hypothetical protein [Gallionella sp.]MDP1939209.1 hypothetical protein [Gallionella sp.]
MKPRLLPSGLQRGIPFVVQDNWSPEQALAVIELLDDLREVIWARYQLQLQELLREQRCTEDEPKSVNISETDPMF